MSEYGMEMCGVRKKEGRNGDVREGFEVMVKGKEVCKG